jgi:hypothetical protein
MQIQQFKAVVIIGLVTLLMSAHSQSATAAVATSSNVDKYFAAIKSAQPLKIEEARKKYVVPNSSADVFTKMIINHFKGTEYLKTLDTYGNVSPTAHDAPGKVSKAKNGIITVDSTFDTIDGSYRNFVLNKSKKITSFQVKKTGSQFVSIKNNIQLLTSGFNDGGTEIKTGIHWKLPTGNSFVQLDYVNNFGGLKSWSYARGYIRDASGVNHDVVTGPLGCTNSGGRTVIEATTSSVAAVVEGTTSTLVVPFYLSCTGANANEIKVPFTVQ